MSASLCKFCLQDKPLIRSHIIPVGLYPKNPNGDRLQFSLDGAGERPKKKVPHGVYDDDLVCESCEGQFTAWDDYAKRFFVDDCEPFDALYTEQGTPYRMYRSFDYAKLKLFFISMLWRAHATELPDFAKVDIGPKYAAMAKRLIESRDPGTPDQFAVFLLRFLGEHRSIGATPTPRRHESVLMYETLLFGFAGYIKADNRLLPRAYRYCQLEDGKPLLVLEKPIEDGPFVRFAVEAYLQGLAAKERLKAGKKQRP